jgi:hypothetical protein
MRILYLSLVGVISLVLVWINIQLYNPVLNPEEKQVDIAKQLYFLEEELKEQDLGRRMQSIFPEGYVFVYALYGLSWAELAQQLTRKPDLQLKAIEEAIYAYEAIDADTGKQPFSESLSPAYGIYYSGWRNYLLSKLVSISGDFPGKTALALTFQQRCEEIATAFRSQQSPYLSSYYGQSWPADSFLAMASLATHDQLYGPVFKRDIAQWLTKVRKQLDPETGMLAHKTDAETGNMLEAPRGGSMTLMLRLLAEIDEGLAKEQYALFKEHFVSTALGLPMVREYPKDTFGTGDVDSGPVILGTGFAGTIVSIGTFQAFGEPERAENQYATVKAFGMSREHNEQKSFLLGMLPMADAFIAWSRSTPEMIPSEAEPPATLWRLKFQLISLLVPLLLIGLYFRKPLIAAIRKKLNQGPLMT